jgi:ATP-dependent RNA helicase DeaD
MPTFEDLGLRGELLRVLEEYDISTPTAVQEAVIPAGRRGGNLLARASSGSGKTLAYLLGVLDRLKVEDADETALRLLVVAPVEEDAEEIALTAVPFAQAIGLEIAVPSPRWATDAAGAGVVVGTVSAVMAAVRSSTLKLDGIEAIVIDGASVISELGDWDQVDALMDLLPRDAQRIVVTPSVPAEVEDLIERRVKRALRYPSEAALPEHRASGADAGSIGYVTAAEREKLDLLAMQLTHKEPGSTPPIIFCRSDERAADLAERLAIRGFLVGHAGDVEADVAIAAGDATREELLEEAEAGSGQTISYDVPADAATLRSRHAGDPDAVVLVQPRELAHLREIARQASFGARSAPMPYQPTGSAARLEAFRNELRRAAREEDLSAQMLVLAPLFDELTAAEVAAAASALLRQRRPPRSEAPATGAPAAAPTREKREQREGAGPAPATWTRLYVSVGSRDDIRPGDLVGALAGEANIQGSRIGKIEIRDSFSIVEVESAIADKVIQAVNGTTMKGRSVRVDYDRGGPARRPTGRPRPGGDRRSARRPPRDA